jgi:eukaryotic-like serine/threonine-protein kinase
VSSSGDPAGAGTAVEGAAKGERRVGAGTVLGSFRLVEPIGTGGMGEVYRAEHVYIPDRPAAIKVMHPHRRRGDFEKRFHSEASKLANLSKLRHPNIVEFYDANIRDDGVAWIAMELLRGWPLDDILARHGRLDIPDALSIMSDVADGLHAAHLCKLVHRDLKLQNLFLTYEHVPKILDFGTAKLMAARPTLKNLQPTTEKNVVIGTWAYMSPEQLMGEPRPIDHRSDIFSLGVIVYELLTQHHAFALPDGQGGAHELGYRACIQPPHPINQFLPECPTDVWLLIYSMLEKNRENRPASMAKVAEKMREIRSAYLAERGLPVAPLSRLAPALDRAHAPTDLAPRAVEASGEREVTTRPTRAEAMQPPAVIAAPPYAVPAHEPSRLDSTLPIATEKIEVQAWREAAVASTPTPGAVTRAARSADRAPTPGPTRSPEAARPATGFLAAAAASVRASSRQLLPGAVVLAVGVIGIGVWITASRLRASAPPTESPTEAAPLTTGAPTSATAPSVAETEASSTDSAPGSAAPSARGDGTAQPAFTAPRLPSASPPKTPGPAASAKPPKAGPPPPSRSKEPDYDSLDWGK